MARKQSQNNLIDSFDPFMLWSRILSASSGRKTHTGNLNEAGSDFLAGMVALNEECASFMKKRLERDAGHAQEFARCQSLTEAGELQRKWLQDFVSDYASETRTLMGLGSRLMDPSVAGRSHEPEEPTESKSG